ncbi:hypothetical protein EN925_19630 [Mesorhizobium sp. M7A.F.Ca.US.006.04.2.1]|uniref:hypothetical protein n=1 Tax=unclassified Mesorhizobium TaxID=325217 RepID=UPI000FCA37BA|nr:MULTISPECIES: hypothetical protein [unclassified Mesorhizobium]RUX75594.1 hypothetical protein EN990_13190 [Mesorhizobium sp. M7A.F.Ca.US.005.03.1.1]RUY17634.1 hypothetical protein EN991_07085 [Mesorhizobium sp. M7A.F.Ca.US.005.03.2.1]RUY31776.1 hypothetical protein EN979_02475 [Mesorhizobium sp. M7A.F.Ca.US.001.04.2.1]RUY34750.1 hypothetical protein EN978_34045 [Mesorhizobium sp. M7A.F.Ca.US.001.04.1.1]RVA02334.1 hypothetical protein EN938_19545 [Mesorhizobium sp. M7A.F.Ca.US.001.02.1.1]
MHPLQFLKDFVEPSVAEWAAQDLSVRHAIIALGEIDNLAEHFIRHTNPIAQKVSLERDSLGSAVPALAIARDIHDTHKHGALGRKTATITRGQKPTKAQRGGGFSAETFSSGFDIGEPALVVTEDDQTRQFLDDVIGEAMRYWRAEIAKLPV